MAIYKNPKVDIKRKYRRYLEEGLILSLIIVILGFLYFPKFDEKELTTTDMQELVDVKDVVVTQQESAPPPPPKPTIPIEVPQDEVLEDIEFTETELNQEEVVEAPPPPLVVEEEEVQPTFFIAVEEMPEPIGGVIGIQKRIVYPEIAKRAGVQGRVYIKAYVDKNGEVKKTEVIKGIGAGCDEAAVAAVMKTKFKPGKQRGKPVNVQVSIPVRFVLSKHI